MAWNSQPWFLFVRVNWIVAFLSLFAPDLMTVVMFADINYHHKMNELKAIIPYGAGPLMGKLNFTSRHLHTWAPLLLSVPGSMSHDVEHGDVANLNLHFSNKYWRWHGWWREDLPHISTQLNLLFKWPL